MMKRSLKKYLRRPFAFQLDNSALLVTDMQRFFLESGSHAYLPLAKPIVPRIKKLIAFYRRRRLPVIFTRHALQQGEDAGIMARWWKDTLREGTKLAQIIPPLRPGRNEHVIRKTRYSAFYNTGLDRLLKRLNVKRVVITGVLTHLCCESTARDAFIRDYEVYFMADATATDNADLHLSSLKALADGFAVILNANDILCFTKQL